jgi:hypothetical protein
MPLRLFAIGQGKDTLDDGRAGRERKLPCEGEIIEMANQRMLFPEPAMNGGGYQG